jgi:hypothetical protein
MIIRSLPLAVCLAWFAYESHFSASFFTRTVASGLSSITQGMEDALGADHPAYTSVASVE